VFPYDEEIISILHRFDSDGDGRLTIDNMRNFLTVSPPIEKARNSDVFLLDNALIDQMQEAAANFLKSMNPSSEKDNNRSNINETPTKNNNSLSRYDYYPYESVRKCNSPGKFNTPSKINNNNEENSSGDPLPNKNIISSSYFNSSNKDNERNGLINSNLQQSQINDEPKKNGSNDERGDFVNKMKEKPDISKKIGYRNTVKPISAMSPFEGGTKKNKSITNSAELEKVQDSSAIKAIIQDIEQRNEFLKAIDENWLKSINEVQAPSQFTNSDYVKTMVNYMVKLAKANEKLAEIKLELVKQSDFNLIDFFSFFDKSKKGFCTIEEFQQVLKEQDTEIDPDILWVLIKRFDRKNTQKMRFVDFERLMTTPGYKENERKPLNIRGFHFKYREVGYGFLLGFN